MPTLSIVIPTLGRKDCLRAVLAALARQEPPLADAEILVVLDALAPDDISLPLAHTRGMSVRLLRAPRAGASAARNHGWRTARAPLILFLDDDVIPHEALVAEHRSWQERHPQVEVGVLGLVKWSPEVKITPFMRWLEMGIQFDYRTIHGVEAGWQHFYSCNVSLSRDLLQRAQGFDEDRFPYGYEDLDLGRRLSHYEFKLLYNSRAVGFHLKAETLDKWRGNLQRIAHAERRFTALYPDTAPYFFELFDSAARAPRAKGRAARLVRFVNPALPGLGRAVWGSYDMVCRQKLAADFLASWDTTPQPDR